MRCSALVMPASSPVLAALRPVSVLISVDLPTLGTPQISTRMGLASPPRLGARAWQASMRARAGAATLASSPIARVPGRLLFSTLSEGRPAVSSASSGLALEPGRRASSSSITASMSLMRSAMALRVRCM